MPDHRPWKKREANPVDFVLFLLVTAIMFIRPTDFVPGIEELPLFQIAIIPCIIVSWPKLAAQLNADAIRERPVFIFGVGLIAVWTLSAIVHGQFQDAIEIFFEFPKSLIFFLLLLAHVNSTERLKQYLHCLVVIIAVPILLATLNYHGLVTIPAYVTVGEDRRLAGTGIFGDPNDVCEVLNFAIIFGLYNLFDRRGLGRLVWLAPIALFVHALGLTQSRGGFLGTVVGMVVLLRSRFGGAKSLMMAGATLAVMFVFFAGRQTSLDTDQGTSQQRIQLWDTAFELFKRSPLIGAGPHEVLRVARHVSHNAFIETYAELGFAGGTLLFAQYLWLLSNLAKVGPRSTVLPDEELRRFRPYLLASMASFATSEMSLTNPLAMVTYSMFGLTTAFIRIADPDPRPPDVQLNWRFVGRSVFYSGLFVVALYVFVRVKVRYG
jgi:O-antigen ligase